MKRYTLYAFSALALLLAAAACMQDDAVLLPEAPEGIPMTFTAKGLNPTAATTTGTRAPVDGDWEGVQSVAVRMDGTVKAYNVTPSTSDNTGAMLTSDDPHYWTNHTDRLVTAWWPYTAGETTPPAVVVKADQSARKDFEGSDLIVAEEQTVSYGNPTLRFTHRTARVTVILTDYTEERMFVRLTGLSTENGNPAVIVPHDKGGDTYTALVAPQSVATGTAFITCKFTNGKVFVYKMKNDTDWQAGKEYTYTVSLAAAKDPGYTVSEDGKTYTVYTDEGLRNVAKLVNEEWKLDINITLTGDIDLTGIDWTPIGKGYNHQYTGTFDGGNYTITGLTVTGSYKYAGLFGDIDENGTVKNVVLEGVQITSDNSSGYAGGVAGNSWGNIENCSVSGSVSGSDVGGVVGYQLVGSITGCSSSATVKGMNRAGGVVGVTNNGAILTACYATGDVTVENDGTSNAWAGGVVGSNAYSTVIACYAAGNVSGNIVGGAVGVNYANVTACYWSGLPDNDNGGATKVDGTTVTWQTAVDAMNAALSGKGWQYELTGALPTLKKQ